MVFFQNNFFQFYLFTNNNEIKDFYIEQLKTPCLSENAYYIESNNEAIIIDPLRNPNPYIELTKKRNSSIKYIFETHFHADFVSGHFNLSKISGAKIIFGPKANSDNLEFLSSENNQEFILGNIKIRVIHTPGHTPESSCYLLIDSKGNYIKRFNYIVSY